MSNTYHSLVSNNCTINKANSDVINTLLKYLNPSKNELYLDIGCGTGNYTNALHEKGFQFIGIDPSIEMLRNAWSQNKNIALKIGSAEKTNLSQESMDGIIATLTIHRWDCLERAFSELHYVLKPNGKIVILTATPQQIKGFWLYHYFPKTLEAVMAQMPELKNIEQRMTEVGLKIRATESYSATPDVEDHFLYGGKYNPEFYLNNWINQDLISHNALANKKEVALGLVALKEDIKNGALNKIIESYENNFGDYIFIIGEKAVS